MTLPGPGTPLEIQDAAGAVTQTRVVSRIAAGILVDWSADETPDEPVTMRWPTPRGLIVGTCVLRGAGRYAELEPTAEPMKLQRRGAVRVEMALPVHVRGFDEPVRTVNVSVTGLLIDGALTVPLEAVVDLTVELPDRLAPLRAEGRVRRAAPGGLLGIELLGLSPGQQDRLAHLVFEQQRVALRRRTPERHLRLVEET